ncbi:hypothetical protein PNOK_0238500 [Pyrrhoderma noxium]|uniref:Uncharacterized protein n=1 Tax=Pyrrhoderma noxium TaxID=2282107 RepID=A0A286US57_9AGAM|nr:hypothetical protein PNOK_0238500 [Pyrrhoderma noxium]
MGYGKVWLEIGSVTHAHGFLRTFLNLGRAIHRTCSLLMRSSIEGYKECMYRTFNDHGRNRDEPSSTEESTFRSSVSHIKSNNERTSTLQGSSRIAESTSTIFVTSLDVVFISENLTPSQTFPALATLTAPPRENTASRRHHLPFFWSWLRA